MAVIPVNTINRTITNINSHGMSGFDLIDGRVAVIAGITPEIAPVRVAKAIHPTNNQGEK